MNEMDDILSLLQATENAETTAKERLKKQKTKKIETLDEGFDRVLKTKLTEEERNRVLTVQKLLTDGTLTRSEPSKKLSKREVFQLWDEKKRMDNEEKKKEIVRKKPRNYYLIQTEQQMDKMLSDLANERIIAVDTETTGVSVWNDELVGISVTLPKKDEHFYIPVMHDEGLQLPRSYVMKRLKPHLENPSIKKVLHNAKFDMHMLRNCKEESIRLRGLACDTMIAMHLLNENEPSYALKNLVTKYLNEPSDTFEELFGKNCKFNTIPLDLALVYAAKDTDITFRMYQFEMEHLNRLPKLLEMYKTVENPLIDVVFDMECTGFTFNRNKASQLGEQLKKQIEEVEKDIHIVLGSINLASPVQLKPALEKLIGEKLDSTDVDTLKKIKGKHTVIEQILKFRELSKLLGTYVEALPEQIQKDGRIHASFNQMGTVTGRFSSSNPNFQNQPKYARKLFVAPEGHIILSGDFSQQEPRILAHLTQEDSIIDAYNNGRDLYSTLASSVFKKPYEECGDGTKERKAAKVVLLAIMYGVSPKGVAEQIGVTEKEAKEIIDNFYKTNKKVRKWMDEQIRFCKFNGFVEMLFGRKRRIADIASRDYYIKARSERQVVNSIIQGSAAIQTKKTMIELHKLCVSKGWDMLFSIHDEIGVIVPETITREEIAEFESIMINTVKLSVPNKTDMELSKVWGEGMTVDEWFALAS